MKETEKESLYNKALERAKQLLNTSVAYDRFTIESIFPELKESEDERIRKTLIEFFSKGAEYNSSTNGISDKDILAWLEKHKYTEDDLDKAYKCADEVQYRRGYEDAKKEIVKQDEQKPIISDDALREGIAHFGITQYQIDNWLKKYVDVEKQDGQKETLCDKCRKEQPSGSCQDITALGRCALEHQGKQKLQSKSTLEVWKDMRLEVYAQASGNRHEPNCSDDKTKMFSLSDIDEIIEKISNQKPVEWYREDEQNLNACLGFIPDEYLRSWLKDVIHIKYDKPADKIKQECHCNGVREPKESTGVLKQLINKEKYAWSEEDEAYRVDILVKLEPHITDDNFTDVQNWFKSIKDRVQPYNRWKPSEEQMDALETAISSLQSTALESLYNELKKL